MASRVSYSDLLTLPDVMDASAFILNLGSVPGTGDSRLLSLKCQTAVMPGFSNEKMTPTLHGYTLGFRGRKVYPQTLSIQYLETSDMSSHNILKRWHELVAGSESGNSASYKRGYSVLGELITFTTTGDVATRLRIESIFPNDVGDTSLSGESSAAMTLSATFHYDRFTTVNIPVF
jgi:hypothetical protein